MWENSQLEVEQTKQKEVRYMTTTDFSSITDLVISLIPLILIVVIMQLLVKMFNNMVKDF